MSAVRLFVCVPEAGRYMPAQHKFPVLLYVDPPDAQVSVAVESQQGETIPAEVKSQQFGSFTHVVWIDKLPQDKSRALHIVATKSTLDSAGHCCVLRRNAPLRAMGSTTLEVVYPTPNATVPTNFTTYGYANPPTTTVEAWLADGNGNTYPGTAINPGVYNWCFAFQNIPNGSYTLYVQAVGDGALVTVPITVAAGPAPAILAVRESAATPADGPSTLTGGRINGQ